MVKKMVEEKRDTTADTAKDMQEEHEENKIRRRC